MTGSGAPSPDDGAGAARGGLRLVVAEAGVAETAALLFPRAEQVLLDRAALRPDLPLAGALVDLLGGRDAGETVGLVVPGALAAPHVDDPGAPRPGRASPGSASAANVLVVGDHVNLALRGPLTGRWPAGAPRSFPCMTGIYQPSAARAAAGAPVYSEDVVAAGVRDAQRLTPFERRGIAEAGAVAYADCLVPAVVTAAFYGLKVAACLIVRAARERE